MKFLSTIFLLSSIAFLNACSATSPNVATNSINPTVNSTNAQTMILIVDLIRETADGQVLFLQDDSGKEYTTITEYSKGEKIQAKTGDKISLIPLEIIDTPRASMIIPSPRSIKVLD